MSAAFCPALRPISRGHHDVYCRHLTTRVHRCVLAVDSVTAQEPVCRTMAWHGTEMGDTVTGTMNGGQRTLREPLPATKCRTYAETADSQQADLIPSSVESTGGIGKEAQQLIDQLCLASRPPLPPLPLFLHTRRPLLCRRRHPARRRPHSHRWLLTRSGGGEEQKESTDLEHHTPLHLYLPLHEDSPQLHACIHLSLLSLPSPASTLPCTSLKPHPPPHPLTPL